LKHLLLFSLFTLSGISTGVYAQENTANPSKYTAHNKGKFYVYWGGNRESFSRSDIHFKGANYDFTLYDVSAHDKPKGWQIDYLNPGRMTIPQTNFRMGYFISDHYNVSLGLDHMKYVMYQDRIVDYTGTYPNQGSYNEVVPGNPNQVNLTTDFLKFEHTDGLNYINTEFCRVDDLSKYLSIGNTDKFQVNLTEGLGAGILFPKTNATLLEKPRHDDFHVAGYGVSGKVGLNLTFYKYFFVQAELKAGYINMPDIRTTQDSADKASQHFLFVQRIIVFGGIFKL
jgi:hypothetical protein